MPKPSKLLPSHPLRTYHVPQVLAIAGTGIGVIRSLRALTGTARRIAGGDFDARSRKADRRSRPGEMARCFDAMAFSLKAWARPAKT